MPADQRAEAEHVYALLTAKKAHRYKIDAGVIRPRSLLDGLAVFTRTLKARLITLIAVQAAFTAIVGISAGFGLASGISSACSCSAFWPEDFWVFGRYVPSVCRCSS